MTDLALFEVEEFNLEAVGLVLEPTRAMIAGTQRAYQCGNCGTVVVIPSHHPDVDPGPCPCCTTRHTGYWRASFPIAGLRPEPADVGRGGESTHG